MFSQSVIDNMSVLEKVKKIKQLTYSLENNVQDNPEDAQDYLNALINIAQSLSQDIEDYLED